ncbi:MAG: hypothetical protein LBP88_02815 [Treponema sp.]|jgi:hypothetical protein|nr:hypothetical protein [Treponema sp.]
MPNTTHWLPGKRSDQIAMCRNWITIMTDPEVLTNWGIPPAQFTELSSLFTAAEALLEKAQSNERTPVITEQCREAFAGLTEKMRFFKGHYFLTPPLTGADLINLGLKPHDAKPTPTGKPTAEAALDIFLAGRHELGIRIVYVSGNPEDKANKGYRIWYKVVPPGGAPVTSPKELNQSFFTRRKKDLVVFDYEDSAKTAYLAVQIENDGIKGEWGPLVSAVIP